MNPSEDRPDNPMSAGRCPACGAPLAPGAGTPAALPTTRADEQETGVGIPFSDLSTSPSRPQPDTIDDPEGTRPGISIDPDATSPGVSRPSFTMPSPMMDWDVTGPKTTPGTRPVAADPDVTRIDGVTLPPATAPRGSQGGAPLSRLATGEKADDLVGQQLGYRYQIIRLLGAGGMGAVYQAWDEVLNVVVALKTVRPEVAADPETARMLERRFKQELLLARRVTHKNIVRVHDMGDVGGIKYITMPFLEGEELSEILKREGKLPVPRVMKLARSVASGLVAAHEAGVVHRDLKPANIMVGSDGEGLIMDFGVARSTGAPQALAKQKDKTIILPKELAAGQTQAGSVVGTVEYMAPEQARAQAVDQRADIYAFGLILYDLLLGRRRAGQTRSAIEELTGRMETAPPPARTIDPAIPEALDRLITRCTQPDADARYQTIAEVLAELDALDDNGRPVPIVRSLTWRVGAAAALVVATLVGLTYWLAKGPPVPVQHDPVSVLIADFQNSTGDPAFDRTLEPMMKLALEGAGFISAYDRNGIARSLGVRPPATLDERAALELAVKQGVNVVLSGAIVREGNSYNVAVKATQAVTGTVVADSSRRANSKEQVLGTATTLATTVREALGDETSDSAQRFAMETLSATSLEVVRQYAAAMEALSRSRFDEARQGFAKAVELDPKFGLAYAGLAIASRNLDKHQDAENYVKQALTHLDGMTERERYRTRGLYYYLTGDYQSCVKEYGDLITRYEADAAARNNLALCLTHLRNMPRAVDEMRQVVRILPNRALYRENLALYSAYGGDFEAAAQEAQSMQEPGLFGLLPLAFAQLGRGQVMAATNTYSSLAKVDDQGASYTASGLADVAIYEGRYADAISRLGEGIAADLASKDTDRAANKYAALAYAHLQRHQNAEAIAAAEKALAASNAVKIRFLAARALVEAGAAEKAGALSASLGEELQSEPQAYAAIIDGLTALKNGNTRKAIKELTDANTLLDTWIGHFDLGRAYLEGGVFLQADSEFDRCVKRRGEVLALFLDEEPTYGFFPPVHYYQGRVRDGLKSGKAEESYHTYLAIRGKSTEDSMAVDVRKRLSAGRPN